jgi:hypothetical protein
MKKILITTALTALGGALILLVGLAMSGCATTGTERASRTTNTMQTVENDYRQVALQVNETNASLQELISPEQTNLKRALDRYNNNVSRMDRLGNRLDRDSADMMAKGEDYFGEWAKQGSTYTDPQIQQLSEERRRQLREAFAQIPEASTGVRDSLHVYLQDLREIRAYLSNDLTPSGVTGVTPVARRAVQEGEDVKTSVRPVLAAIDHARTEMAQGQSGNRGTATGGATGGQLPPDERQLPAEEPYNEPESQPWYGH